MKELSRSSRSSRPTPPTHRSAALLCGVLALASTGCEEGNTKGASSAATETKHPLIGSPAPEFQLPARGGNQQVSPGAYQGKVVIIDFWATWCEPCRQSFPVYQRLMQKNDEVVVLGVSVDDEPDDIADFVSETHVKFPIAWDKDHRVSELYKPPAMPTSYIVDTDGIIRYVHAGFHAEDESTLARQVGELSQ